MKGTLVLISKQAKIILLLFLKLKHMSFLLKIFDLKNISHVNYFLSQNSPSFTLLLLILHPSTLEKFRLSKKKSVMGEISS